MESATENDVEKEAFADKVSDKVSKIFTSGGIAVARITGKLAGFPGKLVRISKDKGVSIPLPALPGKGLFTGGILKRWGGERASLKVNIAKAQRNIEELYSEIGRRSAGLSGEEDIAEHESAKDLMDKVRSYEGRINKWETRLKELAEERAVSWDAKWRGRAGEKEDVSQMDVEGRIRGAIHRAVKSAVFESSSEKAVFEKVSNDLLDEDVEIRLLAAAELGKIPNPASIPILKEALGYGNAYLMSEIIHALIQINHPSCLSVFKGNVNNKNFRVRLGCLKGIYKIAGADSAEYLISGLRDEHQEVRKSAATFLGWIGVKDATPALIQTLKDSDQEVTDAAVMSLSILRDPSSVMPLIRALNSSSIEVREKIVHAIERITGKSVVFELDASGEKLRDNIENLKSWWQKNKMADVEESLKSSEAGTITEEAPKAKVEIKTEEVPKAEVKTEEKSKAKVETKPGTAKVVDASKKSHGKKKK